MNALNAIIASVVAAVLAPFSALPAWVGLCLVAAVSGVLAAVAFRYTSNQNALRRVADRVRASLLAMRLFSDDPRNTLRAQGSLLAASGMRLLLSLPPLLVLIVPFTLLLAHLAMYYEFRPLPRSLSPLNEAALLEVQLHPDAWDRLSGIQPVCPDGVTLNARVREPAAHRIVWRITADRPVRGTVQFPVDGMTVEKALVIDDKSADLKFASPRRAGPGFWDRLLYPGEPAFAADSPIQSISISYPPRETPIFGLTVPWWLTFFIVSILAALAVKPFVGVQF
ncbi:MAG: hypothetical protein AMXMBFR47_35070 [Planctomycetota bacterium]